MNCPYCVVYLPENSCNDVFEELYIREYAAGSIDANMGAVRFEDVWWIN